jgi:hypothetical protein
MSRPLRSDSYGSTAITTEMSSPCVVAARTHGEAEACPFVWARGEPEARHFSGTTTPQVDSTGSGSVDRRSGGGSGARLTVRHHHGKRENPSEGLAGGLGPIAGPASHPCESSVASRPPTPTITRGRTADSTARTPSHSIAIQRPRAVAEAMVVIRTWWACRPWRHTEDAGRPDIHHACEIPAGAGRGPATSQWPSFPGSGKIACHSRGCGTCGGAADGAQGDAGCRWPETTAKTVDATVSSSLVSTAIEHGQTRPGRAPSHLQPSSRSRHSRAERLSPKSSCEE